MKASFIPPPPIRALREVTRYRTVQTQERAREVQRLHAVLQDAGIKLSSVATDIMGVSGRAMINHLVEGYSDPQALAGHFNRDHAFMVTEILAHVDYLEESLARLSQRVEELLRAFAVEHQRLQTIPGVGAQTAQVMVAECGVDMSKFSSRRHLGSWSGLCSGQYPSAGRRKPQRTRAGNGWLRSALVEAAWAAVREGDNYLAAQYHRLVGHRSQKKAIVAVAHSMVEIAHILLTRQVDYQDLGPDSFLRLNSRRIERRCVRQLQKLGYHVTLTPRRRLRRGKPNPYFRNSAAVEPPVFSRLEQPHGTGRDG